MKYMAKRTLDLLSVPLQDKMEEYLLILIIEKLEELMVFKNLLHMIILICFSDVNSVHNVALIERLLAINNVIMHCVHSLK